MAQGVAGGALDDPGVANRSLHRTLHRRFVDMMALLDSRRGVAVAPCRREDPLPSELRRPVRCLSFQRVWECDVTGALLEIPRMQLSLVLLLRKQGFPRGRWEHRHAILAALAAPKANLSPIEVEVLHA